MKESQPLRSSFSSEELPIKDPHISFAPSLPIALPVHFAAMFFHIAFKSSQILQPRFNSVKVEFFISDSLIFLAPKRPILVSNYITIFSVFISHLIVFITVQIQ